MREGQVGKDLPNKLEASLMNTTRTFFFYGNQGQHG